MTDSSADQKDETKPVLGYPHSGQSPQTDHNFFPPYPNGYHYPQLYQCSGDGQPYLGYSNPTMPPPFYFYPPDCQSTYYNDNNNNTPQPQLSNVAPPKRKLLTFPRIFCCLIFIIILSTIIFLLVIWWCNKVYAPSLEVVSFVIHSFEISNSSMLKANWEIDVDVYNPNRKADIRFEHIANSLMYKFTLLETSFSAPFSVDKNRRANFNVEFDIPNSSHQKMGGLKVYDMKRDSKKGKLYFDLKIEAKVFSKMGKRGSRKTFYFYCEDLALEFKNSSSLPEWNGEIQECTYDDDDESSFFM